LNPNNGGGAEDNSIKRSTGWGGDKPFAAPDQEAIVQTFAGVPNLLRMMLNRDRGNVGEAVQRRQALDIIGCESGRLEGMK